MCIIKRFIVNQRNFSQSRNFLKISIKLPINYSGHIKGDPIIANKIYLVKQDSIHKIEGKTVVYMDSQEVEISKEHIVEISYFDKEKSKLQSSKIDEFLERMKEGMDSRFTFLKLRHDTPVNIFEDKTADFFDNAKIISFDENKVKISIARVLLPQQYKIQN